jgi:diguanylate cyclase (GGDEF)-like protein
MPRLNSVQESSPLLQRVNRSLLTLALATTAVGATLIAAVGSALVMQVSLEEAKANAAAIERDLAGSITSFRPLHEVQRQLQLAATSRRLRSLLLLGPSGEVLAASDSALIGRRAHDLEGDAGLGDLPVHIRQCLAGSNGRDGCRDHKPTVFVDGPLPIIGGDHLIHFAPTPLALQGMGLSGKSGLLVIETDLQQLVETTAGTITRVFLMGLLPLFVSVGALVLMLRRNLLPELIAMAQIDSLSGVYNRRAFMEAASERLALARVSHRPCVVALIDIDHFKLINDRFGHAVGDQVIRGLSDYLREAVRGNDLVGRLGGDEFALVVSAPPERSLELLERLRLQVAERSWPAGHGSEVRFTLSIGMAASGSHGRVRLEELLQAADAALYVAKDAGRNRVMDLEVQLPSNWTMQSA